MSGGRIGLGTVQFGLEYGITNAAGRVPEDEAGAILALASEHGVDTIDTAFLYGDSEAVLGRILPAPSTFRTVTKTPKFAGATSGAEELRAAFMQSLERLRQPRVYGLLFHDVGDLLGDGGAELWRAAEALKAEGLVGKIGASVYTGEEIDAAFARFPLDLVQLPYNPIDDRLVAGGQIGRLAAAGVEIHARSVFLQGLLLQPPAQIPGRFAPIRNAVQDMLALFGREGISQLEGVLALAFQRPEIDRFICGVTSSAELHAIVLAAKSAQGVQQRLSFSINEPLDPRLLNPARWPELA